MLEILTSDIGSQMGIPNVSTDQMNSKLNGIFGQIDKLMNGSFFNLVVIIFAICVVALIVCLIFHKKLAARLALGLVGIILAMLIFGARYDIVGWVKSISGN